MGKIGATADIRKTFLSISLDDHDRDYMRFIWWKDGDPEKEIRTLSDPERRKTLISVTNTDNKKIDWPLARVIQLFPSKDGDVRLTKVKMKNGEFLRPIKIGLYPWSCLLNWMPPRTYDPDMDYYGKNEFEFFELEKLKVDVEEEFFCGMDVIQYSEKPEVEIFRCGNCQLAFESKESLIVHAEPPNHI
ncbi:hypothetical protein TNCT_141411 [Trichonephila clavata]|uniref:C2H2-type domain-containing protein n=1 Tax=Trichonephila clavata TaxID=2740835 RepID=A0A8X6K8N0_TRICU|nr:hypothetical protein TNCT_141411 [Trichonephila clavata]